MVFPKHVFNGEAPYEIRSLVASEYFPKRYILQKLYIYKGAKVTRSTSAYALPLFLPRPEN